MNDNVLDTITRRTAARISHQKEDSMDQQHFDRLTTALGTGAGRRQALTGLLVGTAAVLGPRTSAAAKSTCGKKIKKKAKKQCQKQVEQCNSSTPGHCGQFPAPIQVECNFQLRKCCELMADCNVGAGVSCIAQFTDFTPR
jgi:hypothetical protein